MFSRSGKSGQYREEPEVKEKGKDKHPVGDRKGNEPEVKAGMRDALGKTDAGTSFRDSKDERAGGLEGVDKLGLRDEGEKNGPKLST